MKQENSLNGMPDQRPFTGEEIAESFALWLQGPRPELSGLNGTAAVVGTDGRLHAAFSFYDGGTLTSVTIGSELWNDWIAGSNELAAENAGGWFSMPLSIRLEEGALFLALQLETAAAFPAPIDYINRLSAESFSTFALYQQEQRKHVQYSRLYEQAKKREGVYAAAKKLHSKIDVDAVLSVLLNSLRDLMPDAHVEVLLSQDNQSHNPAVKPLLFYHDIDDICTRAFMENQLAQGEAQEAGYQLAVPLSGKQGVYGVLSLIRDESFQDEADIQFITMLADSAGVAFENAKLYEQSNLLITELRLINEITKRLNQSLSLTEIFEYASAELIDIFQADFSVILQMDPGSQQFKVMATNLTAVEKDTFALEYGYSGIVFRTREPVIISDYVASGKVDSKLMNMTNSRSLIAAPITVNGQVIGVIHIAHAKPNFFSYDNYKLLQVISGHIGLAMTNASLHAEVRRMVITDNLTGLYARHYLNEQVGILQKRDACGSLIVVDIDNFKIVNDTFGHQVGDDILIQVGNIIKTSIRETDIPARWGGEELAIYLPQVSSVQGIRIAERIRSRVAAETKPKVTVSCGISEWKFEDEKVSVENLFYKADMALYEAKHAGKNQYKIG